MESQENRESRSLTASNRKPSESREIKYNRQPADPFPIRGLAGAGLDFRHSREGENPDG